MEKLLSTTHYGLSAYSLGVNCAQDVAAPILTPEELAKREAEAKERARQTLERTSNTIKLALTARFFLQTMDKNPDSISLSVAWDEAEEKVAFLTEKLNRDDVNGQPILSALGA
jgi:hypothetical protein